MLTRVGGLAGCQDKVVVVRQERQVPAEIVEVLCRGLKGLLETSASSLHAPDQLHVPHRPPCPSASWPTPAARLPSGGAPPSPSRSLRRSSILLYPKSRRRTVLSRKSRRSWWEASSELITGTATRRISPSAINFNRSNFESGRPLAPTIPRPYRASCPLPWWPSSRACVRSSSCSKPATLVVHRPVSSAPRTRFVRRAIVLGLSSWFFYITPMTSITEVFMSTKRLDNDKMALLCAFFPNARSIGLDVSGTPDFSTSSQRALKGIPLVDLSLHTCHWSDVAWRALDRIVPDKVESFHVGYSEPSKDAEAQCDLTSSVPGMTSFDIPNVDDHLATELSNAFDRTCSRPFVVSVSRTRLRRRRSSYWKLPRQSFIGR